MANKGKLITLSYEKLSLLDQTEVVVICLNQKQVGILKSLLKPAYWSTRWTGLVVTQDVLEAEIAALEHALDGGNCEGLAMEFRDNPLDMCEVQYSNDEGETWTTMFRKDVCVTPGITTFTDIENHKTEIDNDWTTYGGDITNVASCWAYAGESTDAALCMAIRVFVDWICNVAMEQIEADNAVLKELMSFWEDTRDELTLALLPLAVSFGIPGVTIGALAWACTEVLTAYLDVLIDKDKNYFADEEARDDVRCWMYNSMRGDTISYEAWSGSLDTYVAPTNAADAISAAVQTWLESERIFVEYLILVNDLTQLPGELPECDCPSDLLIDQLSGDNYDDMFGARFCHSTLLAFSNPGDGQAVCPGYYDDVNDMYWGIASDIGGVGANIYVQLPADKLCTKIQVGIGAYKVLEATEGDKNAGLWLGTPNSGGTFIGGHSWAATTGVYMKHTMTVENVAGILSTPEDRLYIHNSVNSPNSWCRIHWVHVEMIDYEP